MDKPYPGNRKSGPDDLTVDAPSVDISPVPGGAMARVRLAEGSDHQLSSETQSVLRSRLRIAALMLCFGFAVFLVWHLVNFDTTNGFHVSLLIFHMVVTLVLGACAGMLCRGCEISTRVLQIKELVVFFLPALFFLIWHSVNTCWYVHEHRVLPYGDGMWLMLLFIYALFIPNTWQRASLVIGTFAILPIAMTVALIIFHEDCQQASNANLAFISQLTLKMLIGAVSATVAVHTIGSLRREAFEAKQLGQYRLRRKIGSGGMGEVYLAEHQMMKRPCAIKVIRPTKAGDPKVLARFEREVQTSAKLSHWNNIHIFDYGRTEDGTFYYVMEYSPGMDLKELVDRFGPLPTERVIYLMRQICDALSEAHNFGLIHRDIKPANIIAAERGGMCDVAKLLDFGLAKPQAKFESDSQLTGEGRISGSPLYMSPEQVTNDNPPDERSDIYAVGALSYFLLTGHPPFDDDNPMKVMIAHVNDAPKSPSDENADIPADIEMVVMRCLAKQPEDRYQSVDDLKSALDQCDDAHRWSTDAAEAWWHQNVSDLADTPDTVVATA